jgi:hypothetical protein
MKVQWKVPKAGKWVRTKEPKHGQGQGVYLQIEGQGVYLQIVIKVFVSLIQIAINVAF